MAARRVRIRPDPNAPTHHDRDVVASRRSGRTLDFSESPTDPSGGGGWTLDFLKSPRPRCQHNASEGNMGMRKKGARPYTTRMNGNRVFVLFCFVKYVYTAILLKYLVFTAKIWPYACVLDPNCSEPSREGRESVYNWAVERCFRAISADWRF